MGSKQSLPKSAFESISKPNGEKNKVQEKTIQQNESSKAERNEKQNVSKENQTNRAEASNTTPKQNKNIFESVNKSSKQSNQINEKKIGVPHIENQFWAMLRNGKTKSLTKAFQEQLVTCDQVIVPTSGHTIVHESVILDKRQYFKLCEVYGANWDKPDLNGVTALMKAVALNRVFYVEKLLELGADKNLRDNRGMSAMDYGLLYESYDAVDQLKESDEY